MPQIDCADQLIFISVIIPTIGRPSLSAAIQSVLDQEFPKENFEIIVVNDSGNDLIDPPWEKSTNIQVLNTQHRERSFARNSGAAIARGKYLLFLDDDDRLLPNALQALFNLTLADAASIYYGKYNILNSDGEITYEGRPDEYGNILIRLMIGEWIPLFSAIMENKSFFMVNGFDPMIIPGEDADIMVKFAYHYNFAITTEIIGCYLQSRETTTTDYSLTLPRFRVTREHCLSLPNAYQRLRDSASTRPVRPNYWKGKVSTIYFASMVWNWKNQRRFTALSRLMYGLSNIFSSGLAILTSDFWAGLKPRQPNGHLNTKEKL